MKTQACIQDTNTKLGLNATKVVGSQTFFGIVKPQSSSPTKVCWSQGNIPFPLVARISINWRPRTLDPEKFNGHQRDLSTIMWTLKPSIFKNTLSARSRELFNTWRKIMNMFFRRHSFAGIVYQILAQILQTSTYYKFNFHRFVQYNWRWQRFLLKYVFKLKNVVFFLKFFTWILVSLRLPRKGLSCLHDRWHSDECIVETSKTLSRFFRPVFV